VINYFSSAGITVLELKKSLHKRANPREVTMITARNNLAVSRGRGRRCHGGERNAVCSGSAAQLAPTRDLTTEDTQHQSTKQTASRAAPLFATVSSRPSTFPGDTANLFRAVTITNLLRCPACFSLGTDAMASGRELLLLILSAAALAGLASAAGPFLSGAYLPSASSCSGVPC
jgi:hypothetical protein